MISTLFLITVILFLICILIDQIAQCSGQKIIELQRQKEHLTTLAILEDSSLVRFKLTFESNRPKVREMRSFTSSLWGKSFNTDEWRQYNGTFCLDGENPSGRVFNNSLKFNSELFPLKVENVQLIATKDDSVRKRGAFDGILGLNSLDNCNFNTPSYAVIDQMRGKNKGFSLEIPELRFENEFSGETFAEYDGKWFNIENFQIGRLKFNNPLKGMIDLESRFIKIPASIYNQIKEAYSLSIVETIFAPDDKIDLRSDRKELITTASMNFDSTSPIFHFPMDSYWKNSIKPSDAPNWSWSRLWVRTIFVPHDYNYLSFGLFFLDDYKVSFDLENGKIYFKKRNNK